MSETLYSILGVPPASATEQIKDRYKALVRMKHPDAGGDTVEFARITNAGSVLGDSKARASYDALLRLTMDPCPKCEGRGVVYKQLSFTDRAANRCSVCNGEGWNERKR